MKLKKLFLITGIIFTLCIAFGITANAETEEREGIYIYVVSNGEATITACHSLLASGDIIIPSTLGGYPITSISNNAFIHCTSITKITIPNSVTNIGDNAFSGCSSLTSINIPNGVTSIGDNAFNGCSSLASITIPNSITNIADGSFQGCSSLTSITIPASVINLGMCSFNACSSLASVTIGNNVRSIGLAAFQSCSSLTYITIPKSVTHIDEIAFSGCSKLKDIYYTGTKADWEEIDVSSNSGLKNTKIHFEDKDQNKKPEISILLTIGKQEIIINGETTKNDVAPLIVNSRTMLPIRVIAEVLSADVEWDGGTSTVNITADDIEILLVIGNTFAMVNGEKIELDSPSFIENGRTYLPLRFVSEKLGADVEWDGDTQTVSITK